MVNSSNKANSVWAGEVVLFITTTLDFFISNLEFCLELGLLNSETEIVTGTA